MNYVGRNVKEIFGEALDCASPTEQVEYLDQACGDDTALRARVEALLRAHQRAGHLLERPTTPGDGNQPEASGAEVAGMVLGPYQLVDLIGEGGFGMVYRAEQQHPVRRRVALKVLRPGMDSGQVIARFEAERQALALMNHPNIAKVLDAGEALPAYPGGPPRPYFVMELVEGEHLTDFCDREHLPLRERLELFLHVCRAVQHAHQKGIIHRDLKPSNVLVTRQDDPLTLPSPHGRGEGRVRGLVKVIDFGVAKALEQRLTDRTLVTAVAQVIGTPLYMSPEQSEPGGVDIDTRSDIYSLGVLLYELLTGTTPFDKERLREASFDELRRIIREEEPPRPSARLRKNDVRRRKYEKKTSIDSSFIPHPSFFQELDWIVMKCLEKDRSHRYETADALARDVARYLADEPVEACPPSAGYRLGKFLRKHRRPLATAAAFGALLAAAGVMAGWLMVREARAERDRAVAQTQREGDVRAALDRARALREEARQERDPDKWARAREQAQRALTLVQSGPADAALAAQVRQVQEELDEELKDRRVVADLEAARLAGVGSHEPQGRFAFERTIPRYRDAFRAYGLPVGEGNPAVAAERLHRRPPEVRQAVNAALEDWLIWATDPALGVREPHLDWLCALAADLDGGESGDWRAADRELDSKRRRTALERLAATADVRQLPPRALFNLARRLQVAQAPQSAVALLRRAREQHPEDFWLNEHLGQLLLDEEPQRWAEAARYLTAGVALRPDSAGALLNLGSAFADGGQWHEALACYHRALELDPKEAGVHTNLGRALMEKGQTDEAIAWLQRALELEPKLAEAHVNLGRALKRQGRLDEAIACYQRALECNPKLAVAHINLGTARMEQGRPDEGIACFRRAVELAPGHAGAHTNLALALKARGRLDESIGYYQRALAIDPGDARVHIYLGNVFKIKGQVDKAIACYRRAIEVDPQYAYAHFSLGLALGGQGQRDEAIARYRRALELDPQYAEAHCNLGNALLDKGDFRAALTSMRTGHTLGSRRKGWPYNSAEWVKRFERYVQLDDLLTATQAGKAQPAGTAETVELADFCRDLKHSPAAAVRFYTEALTAEPKLAADLQAGHRYRAAQAAAQAGCGQGHDTTGLDAAERARLRSQALEWLRADLALWTAELKTASPQAVADRMQQWLSEPRLAGVRDKSGLAEVPAEERSRWQALWADVAALRTRAGAAQKPGEK
jgi:tetratricopeptide (TPR) repeat protein/serine/threonine protein kinase